MGTVLSVSWWYDDEAHGLLASTVQEFLGVDKSGFNVVQEFDVARGFGRVLGQALENGVQESMREGDVLSPRTLQVLQAVKKTDPYVLCLSLPFGTQPPAGAGRGEMPVVERRIIYDEAGGRVRVEECVWQQSADREAQTPCFMRDGQGRLQRQEGGFDDEAVLEREWYDNGQLMSELRTTMLDGAEVIQERQWFINGQQQSDDKFTPGGRIGQSQHWYINGQMKSEGRYCGSADFGSPLYCGPWTWWYEKGQKRVQGQFQERGGSAVGRWMIWHPNGQLLLEAEFTEEDAQSYGGEPVGVWRAWYANGQPFMRGEYGRTDVYGVVPTGVWTWWHENGMLRRQGGYAETPSSRKNGGWTDWHDNGVKAREVRYVDGVQQGLARECNAQGKRSETGALALMDEAATLKVQEAERAAQPDARSDELASRPGAFIASSSVYDSNRYLNGDYMARQYLGMTHDGEKVVQDFYEFDVFDPYYRNVLETGDLADLWPGETETGLESQIKITDPYVALEGRAGDSSNVSWHIPAVAQGPLVVWYAGVPGQQQRLLAGAYVNGKPDGMWRMWWHDGTLWEEGAYAAGKRTGTWAQWDQEGRKVWQVEYAQGQPIAGSWRFWDETGTQVDSPAVLPLDALETFRLETWMNDAREHNDYMLCVEGDEACELALDEVLGVVPQGIPIGGLLAWPDARVPQRFALKQPTNRKPLLPLALPAPRM